MNMKPKGKFTQISRKEYNSDKPNVSNNNGLSEADKQIVDEILSQGKGSTVKGKVVCFDEKIKFEVNDFPDNKEEIAFHLAIALDDEESLAWYQKLARERRSDFLKNCLKITLLASERGLIKKTKAEYFAGVVKIRTIQQERLKEYKKKHYEHTTLYGYRRKIDEK